MQVMHLSEILSINLQRIRRDLGWSQEELAHRCGIDRTYISGIERGVRNPTVKVLARIAKPLDVDAFVLLVPPSLGPSDKAKSAISVFYPFADWTSSPKEACV